MNPKILASLQDRITHLGGSAYNVSVRNYAAWRLMDGLDTTKPTHAVLYAHLMLEAVRDRLRHPNNRTDGMLERLVLLAIEEAARPLPPESDKMGIRAGYCKVSRRRFKRMAKDYEYLFSLLREWKNSAARTIGKQSGSGGDRYEF